MKCLYCYNKTLFLFCKDALDFSMAERTLKIQCNNEFDTSVIPVQNPRTVGLEWALGHRLAVKRTNSMRWEFGQRVSDSCLLEGFVN